MADIGVFKNLLLLHYLPSFTPSDIPEFGQIDIFNHLLFSRADYDQKKLKAHKSFDDYRLFEDGHVRSLELSSIEDYFVFRAAVLPTCKTTTFLNQSSYNCRFILNTDGEVSWHIVGLSKGKSFFQLFHGTITSILLHTLSKLI